MCSSSAGLLMQQGGLADGFKTLSLYFLSNWSHTDQVLECQTSRVLCLERNVTLHLFLIGPIFFQQ